MLNESKAKKADKYAQKAHSGATRKDGSPYVSHPQAVAKIVQQYKPNSKHINDLIAASFLHDTIEDTDTTAKDLKKMFNGLIASLVQQLSSDKDEIKKVGKGPYLAKKMINMTSWALVIKLADRLHNVTDVAQYRNSKNSSDAKWAKRYRTETNYVLNELESKRKLTGTQKKLVNAIRSKLNEGLDKTVSK